MPEGEYGHCKAKHNLMRCLHIYKIIKFFLPAKYWILIL